MRLRLRHTKVGKVRFTSHRDTANHWERAVRKAGVPLAYSAGFTPRPKLSFGLALPTGAESLAEFLDMELADAADWDPAVLPGRLAAALPTGYEVVCMEPCPPGSASLQDAVVACTWRLELAHVSPAEAEEAVAAFATAEEVLLDRERKGQRRTDDIRPAVAGLAVVDKVVAELDGVARPVVSAELVTVGRGLRPTELVAALFPHLDALDVAARVLRTQQWIDDGGVQRELLPVDAPRLHALAGCA